MTAPVAARGLSRRGFYCFFKVAFGRFVPFPPRRGRGRGVVGRGPLAGEHEFGELFAPRRER